MGTRQDCVLAVLLGNQENYSTNANTKEKTPKTRGRLPEIQFEFNETLNLSNSLQKPDYYLE